MLGAAACGIALNDEELRALGRAVGAIGELAGQARLLCRGFSRDLFLLPAANALFGALNNEIEQLVGLNRVGGEPVVEGVLDRLLDDPLGLGRCQAILGLALEFGLAHEY